MVDFEVRDRIAEIRKIIADQKADEEQLKELEEELKKKKEELESKKKGTEEKKKKIDEILEDALDEESKELERAEKVRFQRTNIQLNNNIPRFEETIERKDNNEESVQEIPQENKTEEQPRLYRRMHQVPSAQEVYQRLETLYENIPSSFSRQNLQSNQRQVYHELKAIADHWGTQKNPEQKKENENASHYGREVNENPNHESFAWQALADRVRSMAENAGPDPYNYLTRTETVLNRLHEDFRTQYRLRDEK